MYKIYEGLLNALFVSIPEGFIWVGFTLLFLKRFNLLDWRRWKHNTKWLAIPIIPTSISINIFRYIFGMKNSFLMYLISGIIIYGTIIYIVNKTKFEKVKYLHLKTVSYAFITMFGMMLIEELYGLLIVSLMHKPFSYLLNLNVYLNIGFSLPLHLIEFILFAICLYKININIDKFFSLIFKDKILAITITSFLGIIIFIMGIVIRFVMNWNAYIGVIIIISLCNLLILFFSLIGKLIKNQTRMQQSFNNMINID